eukprot:1188718-Prorocentrum_minimum.AAC.2
MHQLHTIALSIHIIAFSIPTIALSIHPIALSIHNIALSIHTYVQAAAGCSLEMWREAKTFERGPGADGAYAAACLACVGKAVRAPPTAKECVITPASVRVATNPFI